MHTFNQFLAEKKKTKNSKEWAQARHHPHSSCSCTFTYTPKQQFELIYTFLLFFFKLTSIFYGNCVCYCCERAEYTKNTTNGARCQIVAGTAVYPIYTTHEPIKLSTASSNQTHPCISIAIDWNKMRIKRL